MPSKPLINEAVFLQHLKRPEVENFLPYMYQDSKGNVTVGIGLLLPDANAAKRLLFVKRHKDVLATAQEIEDAFDRVKNANLPTNTRGTAFRNLTHIEITEKRAELEAVTKMREFLRLLKNTYFPNFKTYPLAAKMGHLDLAYRPYPVKAGSAPCGCRPLTNSL